MRALLRLLCVFCHILALPLCSHNAASVVHGISSFTVCSQVFPHALDLALKSTLQEFLAASGSVICVDVISDHFYEAVSNRFVLKLSFETRIYETTAEQFQVKGHLILECIDQSIHKEEDLVMPCWICEEEVDFCPEKTVLKSKCQQIVKNLAMQFLEMYRQANPDLTEQPTFLVL